MTSSHHARLSILEEFLHDPKTKNLYTCDPSRHYVHVAVIMKRGKVLAEAFNLKGYVESTKEGPRLTLHRAKSP